MTALQLCWRWSGDYWTTINFEDGQTATNVACGCWLAPAAKTSKWTTAEHLHLRSSLKVAVNAREGYFHSSFELLEDPMD